MLDETWEVGVCEIMYPSFTPHKEIDNSVRLRYLNEIEIVFFPQARYSSLLELIVYIGSHLKSSVLRHVYLQSVLSTIDWLKKNSKPPTIKPEEIVDDENFNIYNYSKLEYYFSVKQYDSLLALFQDINTYGPRDKFWDDIHKSVLSYSQGSTTNNQPFLFTPNSNIDNRIIVHLYTNIIEPSYTGDVLAKTIRVLSLDPDGGHEIFSTIYYHKLSMFNFESLNIELRYDSGEYVNFQTGAKPTVVVLHFRKNVIKGEETLM